MTTSNKLKAETPASSSYRLSVWSLIWPRFDAYKRAAAMDSPPEHLIIDEVRCPWSEIRERCRLAAEAYEELLREFQKI